MNQVSLTPEQVLKYYEEELSNYRKMYGAATEVKISSYVREFGDKVVQLEKIIHLIKDVSKKHENL